MTSMRYSCRGRRPSSAVLAALVAAMTSGLLTASGGPAVAQQVPVAGGALSEIYQMVAEASVAQVRPVASVALPDVVVADFGYAHAEAESTPLAIAIAGPAYVPAAGLLSFLGLPALPPNSLPFCQASYPGDDNDATCVGPDLDMGGGNTVSGGNGEARVRGEFDDPSQTRSYARTTMGGSRGFGYTFGSAQSTSFVEPVKGVWTATATMAMQDLDIGGIVTIASIKSFARGTANGEPGSATVERGLEVTGVRALGNPAVITAEGVTVLDQQTELATRTAQNAVNSALSQAGISVTALPPENATAAKDGTAASANSGGVAVRAVAPTLPPGNEVRTVFGRSFFSMSARSIPDESALTDIPDFDSATSTLSGGSTGDVVDGVDMAVPPSLEPVDALEAPPMPPDVAQEAGGEPEAPPLAVQAAGFATPPGCGVICVYTLYSLLAFLIPASYMTRRTLLRG